MQSFPHDGTFIEGWDSETKRRYDGLSRQERERLWRRRHQNQEYNSNAFENEYKRNWRDFDSGSDSGSSSSSG